MWQSEVCNVAFDIRRTQMAKNPAARALRGAQARETAERRCDPMLMKVV